MFKICYSLYMTEYKTASYGDYTRPDDHISRAIRNEGYLWNYEYNPEYNTRYAIELDGSTVIRVYYNRPSYEVRYKISKGLGYTYEILGVFRYGQTVDTTAFEFIPRQDGYRFVGWDSNGDNVQDANFIMPKEHVVLTSVWEGVEGTEYKVVHMVQDANSNNYVQAGVTYLYGTTDTIPDAKSIYSDKYIEAGKFVANYEKAKLTEITYGELATMYAYYDRVEYKAVVKAYDPETGVFIQSLTTYTLTFKYGHVSQDEVSYTVRYGAALPEAPEFTAQGYIHRGWLDDEECMVDQLAEEMPAYDLVYHAYWEAREDTKYTVEHYIEQANGNGYDKVYSEIFEGRTGSALGDPYEYVLYDDDEMYCHERYNTEELVILPDGSAVLKIYYQRVRYAVTFCVVDQNLNPIEGVDPIIVAFKYGQTITPPAVEVLDGYRFAGYDTPYEVMPTEEIEYYIVWNCLHLSVDSGHTCETCYDPLDCADNNDDGHCDYGREPMDPDDHRYVDNNVDHICDICCGSFTDRCVDNDRNGMCDICDVPTLCPETGEDHVDEDENHKGTDGLPEIVPEEAEIVRSIYRMCIEGKSTNAIAKHLTQQGIPTPAGKQVWQRATVESILRNEKYKGAALLQKKFTVDFLQKKMKVNEGEVPQYYVEHSHAAIIDPEEWERVQLELAKRKNSTRRTQCNSPFAGKIICGDCGEIFGSKVWHSTSKYRRTIWRCNAKYENGDTCTTPHLYEDDLKQYFITALSQLLTDRTALLEDGRLILKELLDTAALDADSENTLQEMDVVAGMIQQAVNENANQAADQAAYADRYNSLVERYENLQTSYDALQQQKERLQVQAEAISNCQKALEELDLLQIAFTDGLWNTVVDHVTVYADDRLVFYFKNGSETEVKVCK